MKRPDEVTLSRAEGEAVMERIERDALSAEDRRVLGKVRTFDFWLLFALREAKLSLKRLKTLVFGEKPKKRAPPPSGGTAGGGGGNGTRAQTETASPGVPEAAAPESIAGKNRPPGHGRQGADGSQAVTRGECRQEE